MNNCTVYRNIIHTFATPYGDVSEWLKEHAWKVCIPQKGIASSNLAVSANSLAFLKKNFSHEKHASLLVSADQVKIISAKYCK